VNPKAESPKIRKKAEVRKSKKNSPTLSIPTSVLGLLADFGHRISGIRLADAAAHQTGSAAAGLQFRTGGEARRMIRR
jgi:hypothetical protein